MAEVAKKITFKHVVGGVIMVAFLSSHIMLMFISIPEANKESVYHMQGILDAAVIAIIGFYFGSSAGSKAKSVVLEDALKTEQTKP